MCRRDMSYSQNETNVRQTYRASEDNLGTASIEPDTCRDFNAVERNDEIKTLVDIEIPWLYVFANARSLNAGWIPACSAAGAPGSEAHTSQCV